MMVKVEELGEWVDVGFCFVRCGAVGGLSFEASVSEFFSSDSVVLLSMSMSRMHRVL